METVNKRVIMVALVMAFFTTFLIYVYIKKMTTKPDVIQYINVYVAAKTLPPKTKIVDSDLKQVKITSEYLNSKAVLNKSDIVGKRLKDSIIEGEQILGDRLVDESNMELAFSLPAGKRAVSINVNEQLEVANLLRPGDFVDVLASFQRVEEEDKLNKYVYPEITKIILQDVQVLALGQDLTIDETKKTELPKTVTLAVTPQEAEKLVYASEFATLRLALRAVDDHNNIVTPGTIKSDVISEKGTKIMTK
jgi:pilus assembly protein CpaB